MNNKIEKLVERANKDLNSQSCRDTQPYCRWLEKKLIEAEQQLKNSTTECNGYKHCVTYNYYQLCPKCNGQGIVSRPPCVAGDIYAWNGSSTYICDVCNGSKVIQVHCG